MSNSLKAAKAAAAKRQADIDALSAKMREWRSELEQCSADAARADELRLQALMRDDSAGSEKYASDLAKCKARSDDLTRMITRRTQEVETEFLALWNIEGNAILSAQFEQLANDRLSEKTKLAKIAPEHDRLVANIAALEAKWLAIAPFLARGSNTPC